MKAAIYCRSVEENQKEDVQLFSMNSQQREIEPRNLSSFEQIKNVVRLLTMLLFFCFRRYHRLKLNLSSALGGDGTLLDTVTTGARSKISLYCGINFGEAWLFGWIIGGEEVKKPRLRRVQSRTFVVR